MRRGNAVDRHIGVIGGHKEALAADAGDASGWMALEPVRILIELGANRRLAQALGRRPTTFDGRRLAQIERQLRARGRPSGLIGLYFEQGPQWAC